MPCIQGKTTMKGEEEEEEKKEKEREGDIKVEMK
jgi:hypothetical protein